MGESWLQLLQRRVHGGWYAPAGVPHGGEILGEEEAVFIDVYSPATRWILGELATGRVTPAPHS